LDRSVWKWWILLSIGLVMVGVGTPGVLDWSRDDDGPGSIGRATGWYYNRLLIASIEEGDYEKALEHADRVIEFKDSRIIGFYNRACVLSLMGRHDRALAALESALLRGYDDFAHMESDRDLDNIRDLPRYKALVERYRTNRVVAPELRF